ncbi:MAG: hypothetical protein ACYDB7_10025 [Mycobacteriales bacterium]
MSKFGLPARVGVDRYDLLVHLVEDVAWVPKMWWAVRARIAALLEVIPRGRRASLRLIITAESIPGWVSPRFEHLAAGSYATSGLGAPGGGSVAVCV